MTKQCTRGWNSSACDLPDEECAARLWSRGPGLRGQGACADPEPPSSSPREIAAGTGPVVVLY
jgi:hypothetical protein